MKDWHFLITGGSSGIGLEMARLLIAEGAVVHLTGRRSETLAEARSLLDEGSVWTYAGDVASSADREALMASLLKNSGGRLDGLVINAAKYGIQSLLDSDQTELLQFFQVNALATIALVQQCHPLLLRGQGKSILFISSTLSTKPIPGTGAYSASKAAMNSIAHSFALELAPAGIRVNTILPGVVDTPIHEPQKDGEPSRQQKMNDLAPLHPLGRVGRPDDVARAAKYLLSGEAGWVTGANLNVDGGIALA